MWDAVQENICIKFEIIEINPPEPESDSVDFFIANAEQTFDFAEGTMIFPLQFSDQYIDEHTFAGSTRIDFSMGYGVDEMSWSFPDAVPESFQWA